MLCVLVIFAEYILILKIKKINLSLKNNEHKYIINILKILIFKAFYRIIKY